MSVLELTHDEIAEVGARWLKRNGFKHSFANMTMMQIGEQPDVLGISSSLETHVIEVKVSRSDFFADKKKPHRQEGNGIGLYRSYLVPEGLLTLDDIPYGWMLLEVYGKKSPRVRVVKGYKKCKKKKEMVIHGEKRVYDYDGYEYINTNKEEYSHFRNQVLNNVYNWKAEYRSLIFWYQVMFDRMKEHGVDVFGYANRSVLNNE